MTKIIECVPNFSEGRNKEIIEKIVTPFRTTANVTLLDLESDYDHNRSVVSVFGEPLALKQAVIEAIGIATELIDLRNHHGEHPRMGATDVVPFIPIRNATIDDCIALAKEVAEEIANKYNIPVFLYEKSATSKDRENLADIRKGQFEGMAEKLKLPQWKPDFGPAAPHPTAGVVACGCRMPLVAFNVNLGTSDIKIADAIAKRVRYIGGGLRYVKALGVELKERGIVQVSMNMTDYTKTSLYQSYEMIKVEARRYGVNVLGTEIIGLTSMGALVDAAAYYLQIEHFNLDQIIENRLLKE